jgi:Tfp pilus assembly PilM family ATPase|tara:strand:- start:659 stop:1603 length:945 start_codon:yes stop_codon:yes gene_type:complete
MQINNAKDHVIQDAIEVGLDDSSGITEALTSFKGRRCVVCLSPKDALIQHIRTELNCSDEHIHTRLIKHDETWGNAEIRYVCVKTTGSGTNTGQELLCVGVNRTLSSNMVDTLESAGARVIAVTVPLYASIRAFDSLYRRDGDEILTSMLIDMDERVSMVMISHGANCVFAHCVESCSSKEKAMWEPEQKRNPSLLPISTPETSEGERRGEHNPRGLQGLQEDNASEETKFVGELERCLRHHDALFPDRTIDRIIFTGCGAVNTQKCSAIASGLGISGYIADPSAWITGASEIAGGPSWTTTAGLCLRYAEMAA